MLDDRADRRAEEQIDRVIALAAEQKRIDGKRLPFKDRLAIVDS